MSRPPSISQGKLVDTWYYTDPNATGKESPKIPVRVYLHKRFDNGGAGSPPLSVRQVHFEVVWVLPGSSDVCRVQGDDIEALRATAWGKLRAASQLEWVAWLLIEIDKPTQYSCDGGTGVEFSYVRIYRAVTPDGRVLLKKTSHYTETIEAWPESFGDDADAGKAVIAVEASKANVAALKEFASRIDTLRELLCEHFSTPERLARTLADMNTLKALPEGKSRAR